jgi:hypothetical protein
VHSKCLMVCFNEYDFGLRKVNFYGHACGFIWLECFVCDGLN